MWYERNLPVKKSYVYIAWGVVYAICVGLSYVAPESAFEKALLMLCGLIFFIPPAWLLWRAKRENCRKTLKVLRLISGGALISGTVLLALNMLSVFWGPRAGLVLYVLFTMFAAPMGCIQSWALSLFLWACVLMVTLPPRKGRPGQK